MALQVGDSLSSSRTGLASAVEPLTNGDASQSRRTQGVMNAQEAGQPIHLLLKPSWVLQFLLPTGGSHAAPPLSVSGLHNYVLNILVWFTRFRTSGSPRLSNSFHQQQGLLLPVLPV